MKHKAFKTMRKTIVILSVLLVGLIIFQSCEDDDVYEPDITLQRPVSAFSYTGNNGPAPVTIQFQNYCETLIIDSCTYTWTFGENGPQSSLKEPTHTFNNNSSAPKTFLVTLKVVDLVSNLSQTSSQGIEIKGSGK